MNFQTRKLTDLKVYANNPRDNTNAVDKVKQSILRYGYKVPIVIDEDNVIVAGHTRFAALLQINEETERYAEIVCVIASDLTDNELKEFRIVDNQVAALAKWDFTSLKLELETLEDFILEDFGIIQGFDTELVFPDDPEPETATASDMVKFQFGDYKFEMNETDYHEWASHVVAQSGLGVLEYCKRQLQVDRADRTYTIDQI